jgi:hypothetical protein
MDAFDKFTLEMFSNARSKHILSSITSNPSSAANNVVAVSPNRLRKYRDTVLSAVQQRMDELETSTQPFTEVFSLETNKYFHLFMNAILHEIHQMQPVKECEIMFEEVDEN